MQAAGIAPRVREVDDWVRAHRDSERWLFECQPELSFLVLNDGAPVAAPWDARQAELADLLGAYAALSTAVVCARDEQEELGNGGRDCDWSVVNHMGVA